MDTDRTNDENPTILSRVSSNIKNNKVDPIYYPIGFAAFLVDKYLDEDRLPSETVRDLIDGKIFKERDIKLFGIAEDVIITNKFYLWLESALKENEIYDYETFLAFMRCNSIDAYIYGYTEQDEKCRMVINRKTIPDELTM